MVTRSSTSLMITNKVRYPLLDLAGLKLSFAGWKIAALDLARSRRMRPPVFVVSMTHSIGRYLVCRYFR